MDQHLPQQEALPYAEQLPDAEQLLDGLSIALKHPYFSADPRVLCAVACVCRDWREAVQQCDARNTHVQLCVRQVALPNHPMHGMSVAVPPRDAQLRSFSSWLMRHAALVKSMVISTEQTPAAVQFSADSARVMHRVQAAMLTTAPLTAATPAAAAAAAAGRAQQQPAAAQQQAGLQLVSFELDPCTSLSAVNLLATMAALPHTQHSLTQLSLSVGRLLRDDAVVLSAALARLTRLEQLKVSQLSYSCLVALKQLSCLTGLELHSLLRPVAASKQHLADTALQQLLGSPLLLQQLHLHDVGALPVLRLDHMTSLTEFVTTGSMAEGSVLPTGLQRLELNQAVWHRCTTTSGVQLTAVEPLKQLTALRFVVGFQEEAPLLRLTELPALQQLQLCYEGDGTLQHAVSTADAWGQLPLCELEVMDCADDHANKQQMAALARGLAAATNLTKLRYLLHGALDHSGPHAAQVVGPLVTEAASGADTGEPGAECASIAQLTRLCHLELERHNEAVLLPADVLALTALTGLTHLILEFDGFFKSVGVVEAAALACNLTQLCHLELTWDPRYIVAYPVEFMASMSAIGQLRQLTFLRLEATSESIAEFVEGLMLLTGLSRLHNLDVQVLDSEPEHLPQDVLDMFWAALRQGSTHMSAC